MPIGNLSDYLDRLNVKYETITHPATYTAQEIAAAAHIPGKNLAKTVMVRVDGDLAMAVLPASYMVDFELLRAVTGANSVELASEDDFDLLFAEYETGAMPPFGHLFGLDVYVARSLAEDEEIAFNAGSHTELIKMSYDDFARLARPKVMKFSRKH
ncbi:MAG: YbaK/EbsC family protein [Desulfuromonadales bacterium]|nr:YbaK/EbsC family protein [Desulfuromonadales bacterium]NIS40290.1 YbaK/EbsC family protein [Desulfuromonadales bacterium]